MNSQDLEQHLLEGGKQKAMKAMQMKQLIEEEDLSDEEVIKQMEINKQYTVMRQRAKEEQLKNMEKRNEEIDEQLQNMCVDLDEEERLKKLKLRKQLTTQSEEQSTKPQSKQTQKPMKFTMGSMLN